MNAKHTPGPWMSRPIDSAEGSLVYCQILPSAQAKKQKAVAYAGTYGKDKRGNTAGIRQTEEECLANARLVAAAPELLEACERVLHEADLSLTDSESDEQRFAEVSRRTIEQCRLAIAKAIRGDRS